MAGRRRSGQIPVSGNLIEMLLGLYILVPFALAVLFSTIGLVLELLTKSSKASAEH